MRFTGFLFALLMVFMLPLSCTETSIDDSKAFSESYYVPAFEGTRLAVDVYFPENSRDKELPALFEFTRYWRAAEDAETGQPRPSLRKRDSLFLQNDYILIKVDVRGTGASYGRRPGEYTPTEVKDAAYVVEWAVNQTWSNGSVGAYGTSYSGTTAELLCATGHKAVKAVIPGWSDFDSYESPGRPYGMVASGFVAEWSKVVNWLDNNNTEILKASVRRVGDSLPLEAIAEHSENPNVFEKAKKSKYKDSKFGDFSLEECSPRYWQKEISASGVPMLVLASWLDAGTADGALLRLNNFANPQKLVLMPTSHGGKSLASPYQVTDKVVAPIPSKAEQLQLQLDFLDHYLKDTDKGVDTWPRVKYFNYGEETFKTTEVWPPEGQRRLKYYLSPGQELITTTPAKVRGVDQYQVDFNATTGANNRWHTQMGKDILNLHNRNTADAALLTYTTAPLEKQLQLTGTPTVSLMLSSTLAEGAVIVYLEDVDPAGNSRYITEGGLLFEHRKLSENPLSAVVPFHSFRQADAMPMPVDEIEELTFKLWPTSVLIKKGHSLRIAIAGTDKDTFDRVPAEGQPIYSIYRNQEHISFIELPVIE